MRFLSALALLGTLVGCAIGEPGVDRPIFKIPTDSLGVAQVIARASEASCGEADCPSQMALIASAFDDGVGRCTGFLISDDIIATNAHCIPDPVRSSGSGCSDRVWASFPETEGQPKEVVECSEILDVSYGAEFDFKSNRIDLAYFRLQKSMSRGTFPVALDGLSNKDEVLIYKMDPDQDSTDRLRATMTSTECTVDHGVFSGADSEDSSYVILPACEIQSGNSGSPILRGGEVLG